MLRRRSLAALRREIEPVPPRALAAFLPRWQQVGSSARGVEALAATVEQLQGTAVPASALERLVLPARVADYSPPSSTSCAPAARCSGPGRARSPGATAGSPWRTRTPRRCCCRRRTRRSTRTPLHDAVLDALGDGQALFFRPLADRVGSTDDAALTAVIWDLVWAGHLTNDTLAPLRAVLGAGGAHRSRPSAPRTRYRRPGRVALPTRAGPPTVAGRWSRLPGAGPRPDPAGRRARRPAARAARGGHPRRGDGRAGGRRVRGGLPGAVRAGGARRGPPGLLRRRARRGAVRRARCGGPAARAGRAGRRRPGPGRGSATVLAATDPANPYGAALPWPERVVDSGDGAAPATGHRAGRKAGALVVLVGGDLVLYVERGGRTLLSFTDDTDTLAAAGKALADAVHSGALGAMSVERADGEAVHSSPLRDALTAAGFRATPRGLRLRG